MPVLVWAWNREGPEEKECTTNIARFLQNVLERPKVYVKGTSVRIKI